MFRSSKLVFALLAAVMVIGSSSAHALSSRTCNPVVPRSVKYRPIVAACGGKAGIFLSGKYLKAFSVVFKKADHGDRLANACPDAACSPFKAQKTLYANNVRTICFGASGKSPVFRGVDPDKGYNASYVVKWISIKLRNSGKLQDVEIYCLPKPYPITSLN